MIGYLSVKDMAKNTGLSEERIRQLIRTGQIRPAIRLGGWHVKEKDFRAFLKTRFYKGRDGKSGGSDENPENPGGKTS